MNVWIAYWTVTATKTEQFSHLSKKVEEKKATHKNIEKYLSALLLSYKCLPWVTWICKCFGLVFTLCSQGKAIKVRQSWLFLAVCLKREFDKTPIRDICFQIKLLPEVYIHSSHSFGLILTITFLNMVWLEVSADSLHSTHSRNHAYRLKHVLYMHSPKFFSGDGDQS